MRTLWMAISFAWVVFASASASAQAGAGSVENARAHMDQGQAYYLQGRFGEAGAEFEAAYAAQPFSAFLYNAAVAYENAQDLSRAIAFFQLYVERDPRASDREAVVSRVAGLEARVAEIAARAAEAQAAGTEVARPEATAAPSAIPEDFKSLVSVRTEPEGATVVILADGHEVTRGSSPFSYTLEHARYHVRIEHPDYNVAEQDIAIEPGKVYVVVVNLSQGEFFGYLRAITDPPGAQVFVDDHSIGARGQTPFEGPLTVGSHHVWIERAGYQPIERDLDVTIGGDATLRETMSRVAYGRVRVIGNVRGATVRIDGALVGAVPFEGQVDAGSRRISIEADGMKTFERTLDIQQGQLTPVRVRLKPVVGRGSAWVSGAFSLAALGGGIACAVFSDQIHASLAADAAAGTLSSNDSRLDVGYWLSIGANVAFGVSAVLAGVAAYYFLYDPLPPSEGTVLEPRDWALAPIIDPRGAAGLGVLGRF
jgi:PEGA domain